MEITNLIARINGRKHLYAWYNQEDKIYYFIIRKLVNGTVPIPDWKLIRTFKDTSLYEFHFIVSKETFTEMIGMFFSFEKQEVIKRVTL